MKKVVFLLLFISTTCFSQKVGQHWIWGIGGPRWADYAGSGATWGTITGTLSSQTDLNNALNLKAPLASPAFTGISTFTNSTQQWEFPITVYNDYSTSAVKDAAGIRLGRTGVQYWAGLLGQQATSGTYSGGELKFLTETSDATGLTTKMTLTKDGYLGIGDSLPAYPLSVLGLAWVTTDGDVNTRARLYFSAGNADGGTYSMVGLPNLINKNFEVYSYYLGVPLLRLYSVDTSAEFYGPMTLRGVKYYTPSSQGTTGSSLVNDGSGNLSWTEGTYANISKFYEVYDEFATYNGSGNQGFQTLLTTGVTLSQGALATGETNRWGIEAFYLPNTASSRGSITYGTENLCLSGGSIIFQTEVKFNYLGAAGNYYIFVAGLSDNPIVADTTSTHGIGNDAIAFWYCPSYNTGKFVFRVASNGTEGTPTYTNVTVSSGTWYKLTIEANRDGTSVLFKINGVTYATYTTGLPSGYTRTFGVNIKLFKIASSAANTILYIDNIYAKKNFYPTR